MIAERDQVQAHWESVSPAIRGQIVDALLTVTIMPCPRGRGFDPAYVRIEWT